MVVGCDDPKEISSLHPNQWADDYEDHEVLGLLKAPVQNGKTYLSIYSHIYSFTLDKSLNLTAMVSLRHVSNTDTIYISNANYYNTKGELIRSYLEKPIQLKPVETVEIVIDET